ncbi:MAG: hypothetical protein QOJ12_3524, partial [Thermoleophilales bacterium]|nr:hypothetical protein [Thermoleophilales bacterium]
MKSKSLVRIPSEQIEETILLIRGEKVIIDSALSELYGVSTARLNQQVKRNLDRFPDDFMFRLTPEEFNILMLQNATSKKGRGGRRKLPYAFTEHGALMAANVLNSQRAIKVSVQLIRAFIKLRQLLATNSELARKLNNLEQRYDHQFKI